MSEVGTAVGAVAGSAAAGPFGAGIGGLIGSGAFSSDSSSSPGTKYKQVSPGDYEAFISSGAAEGINPDELDFLRVGAQGSDPRIGAVHAKFDEWKTAQEGASASLDKYKKIVTNQPGRQGTVLTGPVSTNQYSTILSSAGT